MKKILPIIKTACVITFLTSTASAFAATECHIGDTCAIPNVLDKVYFAFSPNEASRFNCEIRATKGKDLQVEITQGADYDFPTQVVKADKDGQTVVASIPGTFKEGALRGEIIIHQTIATSNAEGTVKCEGVK